MRSEHGLQNTLHQGHLTQDRREERKKVKFSGNHDRHHIKLLRPDKQPICTSALCQNKNPGFSPPLYQREECLGPWVSLPSTKNSFMTGSVPVQKVKRRVEM